jgi:hypothetical protein
MQVHVIGNGASNKFFNHQYGYVMACNMPVHQHRYDALAIIDERVFRYAKEHHYKFAKPVYTMQKNVDWSAKAQLTGKFIPAFKEKYRWSSGHHAVDWLSSQPNCQTVHIWGFDSMFTDDLTSQMDSIIIRQHRAALNQQWRPNWRTIFEKHKMIKYIIHKPTGTESIDYGQNCKHQDH